MPWKFSRNRKSNGYSLNGCSTAPGGWPRPRGSTMRGMVLSLAISVLGGSGTGASAGTHRSMAPVASADDLSVLDAFYYSTGGPTSWLNTSGWATLDAARTGRSQLSDWCTWYGVSCLSGANGTRGSRVTHIEMGSNNLTGRLPRNMGNLTHLEVLDLGAAGDSGNHLRGSLNAPDMTDVCRLGTEGRGLATLALRDNSLSGTMPGCEWPTLVKIDLTRNDINGTIPDAVGLGGI